MGGIAGILNFDGRESDLDLLRKMTTLVSYRGPEGEGHFHDGSIGLGHRRLSIIDLTPAARQPMCNDDQTLWIVCNGRLLNHVELRRELESENVRFHSRSDIEVLLKAYERWGPACLAKLNGMFAFVIWDRRTKTLFGARDRLGIKPFFYYVDKSRLVIASEIKQIFVDPTIPKEPNSDVIGDYLVGEYYLGESTFFRNVRRLQPGHFLLARDGNIRIDRYWDIDPDRHLVFESPDEYAERFLSLFKEILRQHLRSDVPVSAALTGGLDSSTIVALADRIHHEDGATHDRLQTFSFIFRDRRIDEEDLIDAVLQGTSTEKNFIYLDHATVFDDLDEAIWHQDEPSRDIALPILWQKMKALGARGVRCFVGGVGADDILAGRLYYLADLIRDLRLATFFKEFISYYPYDTYGQPISLRDLIMNFVVRPLIPRAIKSGYRAVRPRSIPPWVNPEFAREHRLRKKLQKPPARKFRDHYSQMMYQNLTYEFTPFLLNNLEMNSAAFAIENRLPFMDFRLVEFLFSIPREQKLARCIPKIIQRNAMRGILPDTITGKVKKPIVPVVEHWMRATFRDPIEQILASKSFAERGYFNPDVIRRKYREYCENGTAFGPASKMSSLIWSALNLEGWFRCAFDRSWSRSAS